MKLKNIIKSISLITFTSMLIFFSGCNKPNIEIDASNYDTLKVFASVKYLNCSNTLRMMVSTNKGKLLTNIQEAGFGNNNLAIKDSVSYTVNMMDTSKNLIKPTNLLHSGDSVFAVVYLNIGKYKPVGNYGFSLNIIAKSNGIYYENSSVIEPNPILSNENAYTFSFVMP